MPLNDLIPRVLAHFPRLAPDALSGAFCAHDVALQVARSHDLTPSEAEEQIDDLMLIAALARRATEAPQAA